MNQYSSTLFYGYFSQLMTSEGMVVEPFLALAKSKSTCSASPFPERFAAHIAESPSNACRRYPDLSPCDFVRS